MSEEIIIIGAGLAGLSAAICAAENGIKCALVSRQESERAQSVLAAGGINAALDTMGENDDVSAHIADTLRSGCGLSDEVSVRNLCEAAPITVRRLAELGVPFNRENGEIILRNFGGQKKKRTAFAKSSTGKMIMSALILRSRKYVSSGLITRYPHHELEELVFCKNEREKLLEREVKGAVIRDEFSGDILTLNGPVIAAFGGLNGFFPHRTTGTYANSGDAAARLFSEGVRFSNLEMIQYHPTTIGIPGKRCLVSEAARGEGGRLGVMRDGKPWYFMEEKYPEYGNLMPRDVVSREIYFVLRDERCGNQVFLDMTGLSGAVWRTRLSDLRDEIMHYLKIDPMKDCVPVDPAIHYFMGGIDVDVRHATNIRGLFAAGECTSAYHGANRLGGNSLLGAIFGGETAAKSACEYLKTVGCKDELVTGTQTVIHNNEGRRDILFNEKLGEILYEALGIVRNEEPLNAGLARLKELEEELTHSAEKGDGTDNILLMRLKLARAMIMSASVRRESRGAHYRSDFPNKDDKFNSMTRAMYDGGEVVVSVR